MTSSPQSGATASIRLWSLLAVVAAWSGLLGPAWCFVPSRLAAHTPAANLNFAELASLSASAPSTFQTYFNVLAWALAALATVLAAYASYAPGPIWGLLSSVTGYTSLVLTLIALHSLPTTQNTWHTLTSMRLGAALTLFGALALARAGYLALVSNLRARGLIDVPNPQSAEKVWAE